MLRFVFIVGVLLVPLGSFAAATGVQGTGWILIQTVGSPGPGTVTVTINGFIATYSYSASELPGSVAAGLVAALNVSASPVTATSTGAIISVTSKAAGTISNYTLSASPAPPVLLPAQFEFAAVAYSSTLVGGKDTPRNFRITLFGDERGDNADLAFWQIQVRTDSHGNPILDSQGNPMLAGNLQPTGHAILILALTMSQLAQLTAPSSSHLGWPNYWPNATQQTIDFSRIDAVYIDEPYLNDLCANGSSCYAGYPTNPCNLSSGATYQQVTNDYQTLQNVAVLIKTNSPKSRFWINFSSGELPWIMDTTCPANRPMAFLNAPYIDVVSVDEYEIPPYGPSTAIADFNLDVKPLYDWFAKHKSYSGQQVALVPATFVRSSFPSQDPAAEAMNLEEYFDYATTQNLSCNLPLGTTGVSGTFDHCPVWMVLGFPYITYTDSSGMVTHGWYTKDSQANLFPDLTALPVQTSWQAQLADPLIMPPWWATIRHLLE